MSTSVTISLPIADRRTSRDFYQAFLALDPFGAPADDGVPEPLQFPLGDGCVLMLIPRGGFGWVVDTSAEVAPPGTVSALFSVGVGSAAEVDEVVARATAAGAAVPRSARQEEWGYCALVADPDGHVWQVIATGG